MGGRTGGGLMGTHPLQPGHRGRLCGHCHQLSGQQEQPEPSQGPGLSQGLPLVCWVFLLCTEHSSCVLGIPLVYWVFLFYTGYSRCMLRTTFQCCHWEQLYSARDRAAALLLGFLTFAIVGVRQFMASATLPIAIVCCF